MNYGKSKLRLATWLSLIIFIISFSVSVNADHPAEVGGFRTNGQIHSGVKESIIEKNVRDREIINGNIEYTYDRYSSYNNYNMFSNFGDPISYVGKEYDRSGGGSNTWYSIRMDSGWKMEEDNADGRLVYTTVADYTYDGVRSCEIINVTSMGDALQYRFRHIKGDGNTSSGGSFLHYAPYDPQKTYFGKCRVSAYNNYVIAYIYEKRNMPPTVPNPVNIPTTLRVGNNFQVTWGKSTDTENDRITYYVDRRVLSSNAVWGDWVNRAQTSQTSYTETNIPAVPALYVQYRVRAHDGNSFSGDAVSNLGSITRNEKPVLTITSPNLNQTIGNNGSIVIKGNVSDMDNDSVTISATINGKTKSRVITGTSSSKSWDLVWEGYELSEGEYRNIAVTANDGNAEDRKIYTGNLNIVKTGPTVVYFPNGVSKPSKRVSTVVKSTPKSPTTLTNLEYVWSDSTNRPNIGWLRFNSGDELTNSGLTGDYYLHVTTTDSVGNTTNSISNKFSLDNTPPNIPQITADIEIITNKSIKVTIIYSENNSIKEYRLDGGKWLSYTGPLLIDKNTLVESRETDIAGNESGIGKLNITNIDKTPPQDPELNMDERWIKGKRKFTITGGKDLESGLDRLEYKLGNGAWYRYTDELVALSDTGQINVYARAIDKVDNISREITKVARVDNTRPTVKVTGNIKAPAWEPKEVKLVATAYDAHSGVDKMRLIKKNNAGTWESVGDWSNGSSKTQSIFSNGEYYFEVIDKVGNSNMLDGKPFDISDVIIVDRINEPVEIKKFIVSSDKTEIDNEGKPLNLIARKDFVISFDAEIEDKDIEDTLNYKIDIKGPINKILTSKIVDRTSNIYTKKDSVFLMDSVSMKNWPDGVYKVTATVTDSKKGYENITESHKSLEFILLREKPEMPVIKINNKDRNAEIEFTEHKVLKGYLSKYLNKEYALGSSVYNEYTGELDLSSIANNQTVVIYAKYRDINGNYSMAIKQYISGKEKDDGKVEEDTLAPENAKIEEGRETDSIFINIRKKNGGKINKRVFDFIE